MSTIFTFPSPFVYSTQIENHQEIKQEVLPKILQLAEGKQDDISYQWAPGRNSGNLVTNYSQAISDLNSCLNPSHYTDIIWKPLDDMYNTILSDDYSIDYSLSNPKQTTITQIWWNVYEKDSQAPIHTHGHGHGLISGVYILHSTEPNNTVFAKDQTHAWASSAEDYIHTTEYLNEGSVMLFPSSLIHYTLPCLSNRVSISFNLITEFETVIDELG